MARPKINRSVEAPPLNFRFITADSKADIETVTMTLDEYEALRLVDYLKMNHIEAAQVMGLSRPTFTRLIEAARFKTSKFIVEGLEIVIKGGKILFSKNTFCCVNCHRPFCWENSGTPVCPVCSGMETVIPHSECMGDCKCCELLSGAAKNTNGKKPD